MQSSHSYEILTVNSGSSNIVNTFPCWMACCLRSANTRSHQQLGNLSLDPDGSFCSQLSVRYFSYVDVFLDDHLYCLTEAEFFEWQTSMDIGLWKSKPNPTWASYYLYDIYPALWYFCTSRDTPANVKRNRLFFLLVVMRIFRLSHPHISKSVSHPKQALRDAKDSQEAAAMLFTHLQRSWH